MVSIPVRMYKAARRERIRFHRVYRPAQANREEPEFEAEPEPEFAPEPLPKSGKLRELSIPEVDTPAIEPEPEPVARVRSMPATDVADERIQPSQILKGLEVEKDRYAVLDPSEVAALRPRTSSEFEIGQFVHMEEVDPLFLDISYFLEPDGAEKPYALLYRALANTGYAALGSLAMHGREHAALIRAGKRGLILHTLFYAKEVRLDEEHGADGDLVGAKELELAETLVRALAAPFDPEWDPENQEYKQKARALLAKLAR